jgi:hypothetical protein
MAWEVRNNKRYYYKMVRINNKVHHLYRGTGQRSEQAAAEDLRIRQERMAQIDAERTKQAKLNQAEQPLHQVGSLTDLLTRATLVAAGYYQHDHGEWRKRGHGRQTPNKS